MQHPSSDPDRAPGRTNHERGRKPKHQLEAPDQAAPRRGAAWRVLAVAAAVILAACGLWFAFELLTPAPRQGLQPVPTMPTDQPPLGETSTTTAPPTTTASTVTVTTKEPGPVSSMVEGRQGTTSSAPDGAPAPAATPATAPPLPTTRVPPGHARTRPATPED